MIYDEIELNDLGKALICPVCENECTDIEGDYCQICGTQLSNKCTSCGTNLNGGDRFCRLCSSQSTFFRDNLLNGWESIKKEHDGTQQTLGYISSQENSESDFEPNYYLEINDSKPF